MPLTRECAGAVVIVVEGAEENVNKAISIIENIKGEPIISDFKRTCTTCPYACIYAGKDQSNLPEWL